MSEQLLDDFSELTRKISAERGFSCASYKERCLRRRIAVRMRARGVHSYVDYARILDTDDAEYDRLLDALTINVTKLFRNWEAYAALASAVVPALWHRETSVIRVWSAGCSSGEEPYTIAAVIARDVSNLNRHEKGRKRLLNLRNSGRVVTSKPGERTLVSWARRFQQAYIFDVKSAQQIRIVEVENCFFARSVDL